MNFDHANRFRLTAIGAFGVSLATLASGCGSDMKIPPPANATGGRPGGGAQAQGGSGQATGGVLGGGTTSSGGASAGGTTSTTGGSANTGGTTGNTGGTSGNTGGNQATGGTSAVTGGSSGTTGGSPATGGAGTTGGSSAATGGSPTGGAPATGGSGPATSVNCGTVTIPSSDDIISDFSNGSLTTPRVGNKRGGNTWDAWAPGDSGTTPGPTNPKASGNMFAVDTSQSGPCNRGGSLHVKSQGNTDYGAGFGIDLQPFHDTATKSKDTYNAQADGYTGVGFWMKCTTDVEYVLFKVPDALGDRDTYGVATPCNYNSDTDALRCNQYCIKNNAVLKNNWQYFQLYFDELLADPAFTPRSSAFDTTKLTAFQVEIITGYDRQGSNRVANPFECWVDDVYFMKGTAPSKSVTAPTCTAGGSAPGGYHTSGNKILDCNNTQKIFKGMARPSMEWDRAGWNITYNDLSRIRSWNANVVRYSLNQSYWLDSAKGTLYQAYVDRVVKWTLALGMDVILDLHWLTQGQVGSPDGQSSTFWQQIANKYKTDGRVMFEIYNEPYGMDGNAWEAAMQPLVNAIRTTASANNLILAGGLDWAYHLDQVLPANELSGTNIAYVSHPYDIKTNNNVDTGAWDAAFGNLAKTYPVVATEWGQTNVNGSVASGSQKTCSASFYTAMLNYFADSTRTIGWTGWAWFVDHTPQPLPVEETCGFPQLIISYDGTTNSAGAVVKAAMGG
jgi:hypothetical protein